MGNDGAAVPTIITSLDRLVPSRGHINFSRLSVHSFLNSMVDVTGRVAYSNAKTESSFFEGVQGIDFSGNAITFGQSSSNSTSERPDWLVDFGVSVLATEQLTISNSFRYNWFKIDGNDLLNEQLALNGNTPSNSNTAYSRLTKYRVFGDTLELDYAFDPRISAHVGYRYSDRSIDLAMIDQPVAADPVDTETESFDNRTNTFLFGLKARPLKRAWTLYFDFERGENDNFFTRTANYDYTSVRLRNRIQIKDTLALNISATAKDNNNPTKSEDIPPVDFGADTKARIVAASADYTPSSRLTLSSGYTYTKIDTNAVVVFFYNFARKQGISQYFSRDNYAFVSASAYVAPRVSVYGAYRFHNDTGAGDLVPDDPTVLISSYPYRYQTPEARVAIRLNDRLDLNVGYQYYKFEERYRKLTPEQKLNLQDYSAHLPYVSMRWYLGRR